MVAVTPAGEVVHFLFGKEKLHGQRLDDQVVPTVCKHDATPVYRAEHMLDVRLHEALDVSNEEVVVKRPKLSTVRWCERGRGMSVSAAVQ